MRNGKLVANSLFYGTAESKIIILLLLSSTFCSFSLPSFRLRPDVRDRQTDIRQHYRSMPLPKGRGIITFIVVFLRPETRNYNYNKHTGSDASNHAKCQIERLAGAQTSLCVLA